jgi:hypothetical protein
MNKMVDCRKDTIMVDRAMIFGLAASVAALLFILELVRQRRLREEYSLLWLATAIVLLVLSVSRPLLDVLASAMGIFYPPSALFVVAMIFVLFILLHFSTVITRLSQENKDIAQQVALLRYELERASANQERHDSQDSDQADSVE